MPAKPRRTKRPLRPAELSRLGDEALLDTRMDQLATAVDMSLVEERIERLYEELERRGITFRPHTWLSDEWFSPDGIPGIAVPFYLGHPRLMRMERKQMFEVEGGPVEACMKILRHEAGHAIDTAYRLRRRSNFREVFGSVGTKYPDFYKPKPYSRRFVQHLDMWYAQAHPIEDFAETFAVWLKPRSRWRTQYKGWPALEKLRFVDELMKSIGDEPPRVRSRAREEPLRSIKKTLREHYTKKRDHYGLDLPGFFDGDLRRLFSNDEAYKGNPAASTFLRRVRPEIRHAVAKWTSQYEYAIDQVLREMTRSCKELELRLRNSEEETKRDAIVLVTVQTMNYLHGGRHRVAL